MARIRVIKYLFTFVTLGTIIMNKNKRRIKKIITKIYHSNHYYIFLFKKHTNKIVVKSCYCVHHLRNSNSCHLGITDVTRLKISNLTPGDIIYNNSNTYWSFDHKPCFSCREVRHKQGKKRRRFCSSEHTTNWNFRLR